jgi:hypothetical protein
MADPEIIERLDLILALLQLAYNDEIEVARERLRQDAVNVAILEACDEGWVTSSALQKTVAVKTGSQLRTIQRRVAELVGRRALWQRGAAATKAYRSSGII